MQTMPYTRKHEREIKKEEARRTLHLQLKKKNNVNKFLVGHKEEMLVNLKIHCTSVHMEETPQNRILSFDNIDVTLELIKTN